MASATETEAIFRGLPAMLSLPRAAKELSVSRKTIGRLVQRWKDTGGRFGLGPTYHVGNKAVIATRTIVEYLEADLEAGVANG